MKISYSHPYTSIRIILFLLTLAAGCGICRSASHEAIRSNAALLSRLDSLIANHDAIIAAKETRISSLRKEAEKAVTPARRLDALQALYHEYMVYNPDSAMAYAREASRFVGQAFPDDADRQAGCLLDEAFIHATQGFGEEAEENLERIDVGRLSADMKLKFFHVGQYIYSARALFTNNNADKNDPSLLKANAYRDSITRLDPDHLQEMLWAPIARSIEVESDRYHPDLKAVEQLEKAVESSSSPSRENAINAYWLARHYKNMDDETRAIRYMTMAAIYDAEIENREIAAATELASWLFDLDDLDRAYTYIIYSSEQANAYNNRARVLNVSTILPTVREAYREAIIKRDHRLRIYLWCLVGLAIVLLGSVAYIFIENRRLNRTRLKLADTNSRLEATVADRDRAIGELEKANAALSDANRVLAEADKVKEGLVTLSFRLTTDFINDLDDYRKKLLRKFKLKDYTDLGVTLTDQELVREEYQKFYKAFDHTVLSIFPEFVEEYNAEAADEDSRVDPEPILKTRTLNTRLRIHALKRLGVDKSADIARMLNISIRTVYNNRN